MGDGGKAAVTTSPPPVRRPSEATSRSPALSATTHGGEKQIRRDGGYSMLGPQRSAPCLAVGVCRKQQCTPKNRLYELIPPMRFFEAMGKLWSARCAPREQHVAFCTQAAMQASEPCLPVRDPAECPNVCEVCRKPSRENPNDLRWPRGHAQCNLMWQGCPCRSGAKCRVSPWDLVDRVARRSRVEDTAGSSA